MDVVLASVVDGAIKVVSFLQEGTKRREAGQVQRLGERFEHPSREVGLHITETIHRLLDVVVTRPGRVNNLGLVHDAVPKTPLVGLLVDNHGVFHIIARVRDHCDHRIGADGMLVAVYLVVLLRADYRALRAVDAEHLVIWAEVVVVVGRGHGLFQHLALVHVTWRLVVIGEWSKCCQSGEHPRRLQLLVSEPHRQLLWDVLGVKLFLLPSQLLVELFMGTNCF
mmetsp:Transcript_63433/g.114346  ORF Transcript_63433/g.114346 Transcript_63433/m.114346 type:complete len:224 (-) Transcript_63433:196-867(-)